MPAVRMATQSTSMLPAAGQRFVVPSGQSFLEYFACRPVPICCCRLSSPSSVCVGWS